MVSPFLCWGSKSNYQKMANSAIKWPCLRVDCKQVSAGTDVSSVLATLVSKIDIMTSTLDRLQDIPASVAAIQNDIKFIQVKFDQLEPRLTYLEQRISNAVQN